MSILTRFSNRYITIFENSLDVHKRFVKMRPIAMRLKPYTPQSEYTEKFDYDKKNMRLGRPLSPHFTIHKQTFNMVTSLSHRLTGVLMSSYMTLLGTSALLFPSFPHLLMTCDMAVPLHILLKATIAVPICYHYVSGIRKLIWCCGKYLTKKEITLTGCITVTLAIVFTLLLVFVL